MRRNKMNATSENDAPYNFRRRDPAPGTKPSVADVMHILCVAYGEFTASEIIALLEDRNPASIHTTISRLRRAGVVIEKGPATTAQICQTCGQKLSHAPESSDSAVTTRGPRPQVLTVRDDVLTALDEWYTEARVDAWLAILQPENPA